MIEYYVTSGLSVLLRHGRLQKQFVAGDRIPTEFVPEAEKLEELLSTGVLVLERPATQRRYVSIDRPGPQVLLTNFPSLARIYGHWELRLRGEE